MATCPIQTFPALDALPGIRAAFLARCPDIDTATDRATALARLAAPHDEARIAAGFGDMPVITAEQVHGREIAIVRDATTSEFAGVDGLVTALPGVCLGIYVADCAAVYLADRRGRGIALVHSGKKGTELGIVPAAIRRLREEFSIEPGDLVMQISPCIRPPHYEVDFASTIRDQAFAEGVVDVALLSACTASDLSTYYSYRAESGQTGRMLSLLALTPPKAMSFSDNLALFGADPMERIVAVEFREPDVAIIFRRDDLGATVATEEPFQPFLWSAETTGYSVPLGGDATLRHLSRFGGWPEFLATRDALKKPASPISPRAIRCNRSSPPRGARFSRGWISRICGACRSISKRWRPRVSDSPIPCETPSRRSQFPIRAAGRN